MRIDQEIAVRSVFILTHASFKHWRITHGRQPFSQSTSNSRYSFRRDDAFAGIWIELRAVRIDRQLETAVVNARNSIDEIIEVDPGGKYSCVESLVARWHTEEEHFLARDVEK